MNDERLREQIIVKIRYEDEHRRKYGESFDLDMSLLSTETTSSPGNTDEKGIERRLVQAVESIARHLGSY